MDDPVLFDDLRPSMSPPASVYDDMFESYFNSTTEPPEPSPRASSSSSTPPPVFDKPVFDDDPDAVNPFAAIPLFEGGGSGGDGEEDFRGDSVDAEKSDEGRREPEPEPEPVEFDDELLPGLGGSARSREPVKPDQEAVGFDDLIPELGGNTKPVPPVQPEVTLHDGVIPGFVGSTNLGNSARDDHMTRQEQEPMSSSKMSVSMPDDPFVILGATPKPEYSSFGLFPDYLGKIGMPVKSENTKVDAPTNSSGRFQGSDMFAGFPEAMPSFSFASQKESDTTGKRSVDSINSMSQSNHMIHEEPVQQGSTEATANILPEMNVSEPSVIDEVPIVTGFRTLNPFAMDDGLPEENKYSKMPDDVWLTVSDITLVTQPTSAPPPSRPPPPLLTKRPPNESVTTETYPYHHNQGYHHPVGSADTLKSSQIDELEKIFTGKPAKSANGHLNHEGMEQYSYTGTANFMDQSDVRDSKGMDQGGFGQYGQEEIDEKLKFCDHKMEKMDEEERLENERRQREYDVEQRRAERERIEELEREREKVRQREQEEQKRREKEREARQAVEKAIREARERASVEARMRAESDTRRRAERAAVQKAAAEARERAAVVARERAAKAALEAKERAAAEEMERAEADARERAAEESRERDAAEAREKAAAEARAKAERAAVEKAAAEARRRAERAAFERVAAEVRQRAANEARERAAAEARARENQQRAATAQPDLESFFGMPSRSQTATTNPFDVHPQGNSGSGTVRTSSSQASPFMQPSSSNPMHDLSSIFGAPSSSAVFQELNGESEERRKARLERHQRTMERAAKALAEKNERDLQAQREQEERHRIGETLDFEIKRWAAGKEGNLRALLSTLQYILWPECGWRPVSLTDLITAASVKKEYRKATLCIHPDKVQQKGANLQQKYIAEKVFDLLKEAWNKFNSEELF